MDKRYTPEQEKQEAVQFSAEIIRRAQFVLELTFKEEEKIVRILQDTYMKYIHYDVLSTAVVNPLPPE